VRGVLVDREKRRVPETLMDKLNPVGKMVALEIASEIPPLLLEHPEGASLKVIRERLGLDYNQAYAALPWLEDMGIAKRISRCDRFGYLLVPMDYAGPVLGLTDKQKAVLQYLCEHSDANGCVAASYLDMNKATGLTMSFGQIEGLDRKGYLEIVLGGTPTRKTLYRIYPNGDGPQGHSWPRPKGATPTPTADDSTGEG
jgi:hypothetical protein